jgi:hypothetical protein
MDEQQSVKDQSAGELKSQVERMLRSRPFLSSETSSKLLQFLAQKSTESLGSAVKEVEIATDVLGRKADFDPRYDSSVRVQMARLRAKLAEYTAGEGAGDAYLIEVPKGLYRLQLLPNPAAVLKPAAVPTQVELETKSGRGTLELPPPPRSRASWISYASLLLWTLAIAGMLVAYWRGTIRFETQNDVDGAVRQFWRPFLADPQGPLVILSNAPFMGTPVTGLRYGTADQAGNGKLEAHYTGVGEALSVHSLDVLFHNFTRPVRIRLANSLAVGEARDQDLIFLGAPIENLMLGKVITLRNFTFRAAGTEALEAGGEIVNQTPRPGEPAAYRPANLAGGPATEDYALISRIPLDGNHMAIVAAGTTTIGTEAAVDYVCNPASLKELQHRLGPEFQKNSYDLVLHVKIVDDTPLHSDIVALRVYPTTH